MKHITMISLSAFVAFSIIFMALATVAFAEGRGSEGSRRVPTLTRVLAKLVEKVPEQANSPEAVAEALANEPQNNSANNENGNNGNNGGAQGGNGGNGGNSSPGGLVKAGSVVSNATAINAINTAILRISTR